MSLNPIAIQTITKLASSYKFHNGYLRSLEDNYNFLGIITDIFFKQFNVGYWERGEYSYSALLDDSTRKYKFDIVLINPIAEWVGVRMDPAFAIRENRFQSFTLFDHKKPTLDKYLYLLNNNLVR